MKIDEFWQIVDKVNFESGGRPNEKCKLLTKELESLSQEDLISFTYHFDVLYEKAFTWNIMAGLYIMIGCSSQGLMNDFRGNLISHGRKVYEEALINPDSLAKLEFENFDDICDEGYRFVPEDVQYAKFEDVHPNDVETEIELQGKEWNQDEVKAMYPKLAAKYPDDMFD